MTITKDQKDEIVKDFRRSDSDVGSPEVQIAVLTKRVQQLTEHLKEHHKDHAGRRGLKMMVSRRRKLLDYLKRINPDGYLDIIGRLSIRK